ncbi:glycosyltransferase family 2 protein [Flavobacterium sp. SLB02]|uniref:glycosyltransferase family 2 protein n=1 Tax=Flavobacterium sp. SLB02 TaxID=2665645 RepID=UPI0012A9B1E9|nr:glycosyltransferase family 2 protein [Flavobacterium sp. SLB02]QGK76874.1 glycosyltransferase [Flavobacterium sp. SLB02]
MKNSPIVTILLATFNRAHLIEETLHSIIDQTYVNWECIIIDDHSTDSTKEVVNEYVKKDNRFSYYLKSVNYKQGLSGSRNYSLDIAKSRGAKFIQFFDDDDIMHPKKLELQIKPLIKDESLAFSICKYRHYYGDEVLKFDLVDEACNIVSDNLFKDFLLGKMTINSLGQIWRGDLILKYRFDEDLLYAEERDLYLKIFLCEKPKYKNIDYVLFYYRKHLISNTKERYDSKIIKMALYRLELNLFEFVEVNSLWDFFLLKQMLKKHVFFCFDASIYDELRKVIDKKEINLGYKKYLIKMVLSSYILFRKSMVKFINKV